MRKRQWIITGLAVLLAAAVAVGLLFLRNQDVKNWWNERVFDRYKLTYQCALISETEAGIRILDYSETGGTISGARTQTVKRGEYASSVEAVPNDGYYFAGWSDGVIEPSRTDVCNGKLQAVAFFAKEGDLITISYRTAFGQNGESGPVVINAEPCGSIEGATIQILRVHTAATAVTARANEGYTFLGWSDGVTEPTRTDIATVNRQITAIFGVESTLPVIQIFTEDAAPVLSKEDYVNCVVYLDDGTGEDTLFQATAGIRVRGNATSGPDKKPYRIKFDTKQNLLSLGNAKGKNWVLLADYFDPTQMRNLLTLGLGNRLSNIEFASHCCYVEVYLNMEYRGLYLLGEHVQATDGRVEVEESTGADSGYLVELDNYAYTDGSILGYDYFTVTMNGSVYPYVIKTDGKEAEQVAFVSDSLQQLYYTVYAREEGGIRAILDVDSAVDTCILQLLASDPDSNWSSFYLAKDKGGKWRMTSPWDFDFSYGNYNEYYETDALQNNLNHLLIELMAQDWFRALLRARLQELKAEGIFEELIDLPWEWAETYRAAYEKNEGKWQVFYGFQNGVKTSPAQNDAVYTFETYLDAVEYLTDWLQQRIDFIFSNWG